MRSSFLHTLLASLLLLAGIPNTLFAQDVTISPETGYLLTAMTSSSSSGNTEIGVSNGLSSLWQHYQLPLTLISSDDPDLLENGTTQKDHANNLKIYNDKLVLFSLSDTGNAYFTVSLPYGYKITGYNIKIKANLSGNFTLIGTKGKTYPAQHSSEWFFKENEGNFTGNEIRSVSLGATDSENEYTLQRTSTADHEMGSTLYFTLDGDANKLCAIEVEYFLVEYSSEGNRTVSVSPSSSLTTAVSMDPSPMFTNKLDLGQISQRTREDIDGNILSYLSTNNNVTNISAYNLLYQDDALRTTSNGRYEAADVATQKHITGVQYNNKSWYGLEDDTYYIECPTSIKNRAGTDMPVGYRIVGAEFHYALPEGESYYYIRSGNYYLTAGNSTNANAATSWSTSDQKKWYYDETNHRLYTTRNGTTVYMYTDNYYNAYTTTNANNADEFYIINNQIVYYYYYSTYYLRTRQGGGGGSTPYFQSNINNSNRATVAKSENPSVPYKITFYNAKGEEIDSRNVNPGEAGDYTITAKAEFNGYDQTVLNNDAVKFKIESLSSGQTARALVTCDLTLQALDPFVKSMDVMLMGKDDKGQTMSMRQQFSATNFKVGGPEFTFNLPSAIRTEDLAVSFENLYSPTGDYSYTKDAHPSETNSHYARYNFVKSKYFDEVDKAFYASATTVKDDDRKADKIRVDVSGDRAFKFNNAQDLSAASGGTKTGYYTEYFFSTDNYANVTGGKFDKKTFSESDVNNPNGKAFYVFTSDETKYNIAPTTATEHRYYAYYDMTVKLKRANTNASYRGLTLTPIYPSTLHVDESTGNIHATDAMYGVEVVATDAGGNVLPEGESYLTSQQIYNLFDSLKYNGNEVKPSQLLYADCSSLAAILFLKEGSNKEIDFKDLREKMAPNAILFLPGKYVGTGDNMASQRYGDDFTASGNFVLVDKQPFYSPFNVQIDASCYATYTREVSKAGYDQANAYSSIMLPFALDVSSGLHINKTEDGMKFKLLTMNANNCLTQGFDPSTQQDEHYGVYKAISGGNTEANKPYVVEVDASDTPSDSKISFVASQYGALIYNTTAHQNVLELADGSTSKGTVDGKSYTFTPAATYSGMTINRDKSIFYYANNHFRSNQTIKSDVSYGYPFRSYYTFSGPSSVAAKLAMFGISTDFADGTGITLVTSDNGGSKLALTAGYKQLTITAAESTTATIYSASGIQVSQMKLAGGESQTIGLSTGIYVVNGQKVVVK